MSGELIKIEYETLPSAMELGYSQDVKIPESDWRTSVFLEGLESSATTEVGGEE